MFCVSDQRGVCFRRGVAAMSRRGGGPRSGRHSSRELPETIPDLAAWWDASSLDYFTFSTGSQISVWAPRYYDAEMGSVALEMSTGSVQPERIAEDPDFGGAASVSFDAVDRLLMTGTLDKISFMHDGSGGTMIAIRRVDSTGPASQYLCYNGVNSTSVGYHWLFHSTNQGQIQINDGDGGSTNANAHVGQGVRDVSAWQAFTYQTGTRWLYVSGQANSQADASPPTSANASAALRVGHDLKGKITDILFYRRVLTSDEVNTKLANWAAEHRGVAA